MPNPNKSNSLSLTNCVSSQFNILDYEEIEIKNEETFVCDSFCDGFLVAGLPLTNSKVITDSDNMVSVCTHKDCALLPAYKPEVLKRFPKKDHIGLELSNTVN